MGQGGVSIHRQRKGIKMGDSQAIATVVHSSTDLATLDEFDAIITGMAEAPEAVEADPAEVSREIVAQLLAATSDEELELKGSTSWRDELMERPIEIRGFRWRKSDYAEGAPVYVLVQGVDLTTGEYHAAISCGSYNVLAQLSNLARRGQIPGAVWSLAKADKPTANGFYPLWLTKTPEETVEAYRRTLVNPLLEEEPEAEPAPAAK